MILSILLVTLIALAIYIYFTVKEKQRYFEKLGIPYEKPMFLLGNSWKALIGKENMGVFLNRVYRENSGHRLVGIFHGTVPVIIVRDPELVGTVLTKEFSHFHDRGMVIDDEVNPLEGHLFNLSGSKWKTLRSKLSPTFTSGKIKGMVLLMEKCVDVFIQDLESNLEKEIDLKIEFMKLAAHVIGSCTFGIETDSIRNENSDFIRLGTKIIQPDFKEFVLTLLRFFFPSLAKKFKFHTIPTEVNDFFFGLVKGTLDHRKNTGYSRNDFLQLLLELREKGEIQMTPGSGSNENESIDLKTDPHEDLALTDNVLTAQAALFMVAGFETTSTSLAFTCYELSKNHDVQEKLRSEVRTLKAKYDGFSYDALKEMRYMDAVIDEVLRLWPPIGGLLRVCNKTTVLGGYTIEKGVIIHLPSEAIQRDVAYYPDPDLFRPERFIEGSPSHNTFLPFGGGPRACIGERFARIELKATIAKLLDKFKIDTCSKMASFEPIKFKIGVFINVPNDGIFCVFSKIDY